MNLGDFFKEFVSIPFMKIDFIYRAPLPNGCRTSTTNTIGQHQITPRSILIRIKACIISHLKDFHDQVSRRIVDFDRSALDLIPETLTTPDRIRII
jgi:hypothetical protein